MKVTILISAIMFIEFPDKLVPYSVFLEDLSTKIAEKLISLRQQPEVISQRQAYSQYGRANVKRWVKQNKVHPLKRPGKIEYKTSELRAAQSINQDYFK